MKVGTIPVAVATLLMLVGCSTEPTFDKGREEAEVARVDAAVMNARSGAEMAPYLDPNHTFIWDVVDHPRYGLNEVTRHIDQVLASPNFKNFKARLVHIEVEAGPTVAFANSIQNLMLKDDNGKVLFDSDYRVTNTYHKVNGKWLMVGEHLSFPIDLATGKAVFGKAALPPGAKPLT